jgi:hypothetical protein
LFRIAEPAIQEGDGVSSIEKEIYTTTRRAKSLVANSPEIILCWTGTILHSAMEIRITELHGIKAA